MLIYKIEFYLTGDFTEIILKVFQISHIFDVIGKTKILILLASMFDKNKHFLIW